MQTHVPFDAPSRALQVNLDITKGILWFRVLVDVDVNVEGAFAVDKQMPNAKANKWVDEIEISSLVYANASKIYLRSRRDKF